MSRQMNQKAKVCQPRQNGEKEGNNRAIVLQRPAPKRGTQKGRGPLHEALVSMKTHLTKPPPYPRAFDAQPIRLLKRRWVSAESVAMSSATFLLASGHNQFLVATVNGSPFSTGVSYADCWRIKRIDVWTINYIDNATTASLRPHAIDIDTNCFNDREAIFTCSSRSEAKPGCMSIIPAPDTPLGSWHKTSTVNSSGILFYFNVDAGGASSGNWATTTMDITFEYVENTVGLPNGYSNASLATGLTIGSLGGANIMQGGLLLQGVNVFI